MWVMSCQMPKAYFLDMKISSSIKTYWGNFMSGGKKAYFGHEVSPHLQTNIKQINWANFMTDARS